LTITLTAIALPCLSTASKGCFFEEEEGVLNLGRDRGLAERGLVVVVVVVVPGSSWCCWLLLGEEEEEWPPLAVLVSDVFIAGGGDDSTVESSFSLSPLFLGVVREDRGRPRLRRLGRLNAILVGRLLAADALEVVSPPPLDVLRRRVGSPTPNGLVIVQEERD
jgi:hypothetical protein